MIGKKKAALCLVLFAIVGFCAAPAFAGLLDHGTPYGTWSGSTTFQANSDPNLRGHIDWVVFGPDGFPFDGYTPTSGELSYAYQLFNEGSEYVSEFIIPTSNPTDNISSFSDAPRGVTGDLPNYIDPDVPDWGFDGIAQDGNSEGLVYSSGNVPMTYYSIILNGGVIATAQVPAPSSTPIPEPATLWSLMIALGLLGIWQFRRS